MLCSSSEKNIDSSIYNGKFASLLYIHSLRVGAQMQHIVVNVCYGRASLDPATSHTTSQRFNIELKV